MDKNSRLKRDHTQWEHGGGLTSELSVFQKIQLANHYRRDVNGVTVPVESAFKYLIARHPAKNGFIVVFNIWADHRTFRDHGDKPLPEDMVKVKLQMNQIILKHNTDTIIAYHKYPKALRNPRMTGTFAQNERMPVPGQTVWMTPGASGEVIRSCLGTPSILSFVDIKIGLGIITYPPDQLFDHQPEEVEYTLDGQTVRYWE